jgi:hypothetical protein
MVMVFLGVDVGGDVILMVMVFLGVDVGGVVVLFLVDYDL